MRNQQAMTKQPVYLVPFSHLDLFWGGSREECLSRGSQVIRAALDLLGKYPSYRFMVESTNFLSHHLDCFPEDLPRIRTFAHEGRLELIPMRSIIASWRMFRPSPAIASSSPPSAKSRCSISTCGSARPRARRSPSRC